MFCPYCGCKVDDGFKFCPKCGDKLQPIESSAHVASPRWMQRGNATADGTPRRPGTCKQSGDLSDVRGWFRHFAIAPDASAWKCAAFFAIGIVICWVGWMLVDASTGWDAINLHTSAYRKIYGCGGPTFSEWILFAIGMAIDICGIVYAYYAWTELLNRIKRPSWNMPPPVAKTIAVVMCLVFFCLFILILAAVKGTPSGGQKNMSVWDYLIMIAGLKAIWRFFVGTNTNKEMSKQEIGTVKLAKRNLWIRIFVYLAIGIIAVIIICLPLCRTEVVDDSKETSEPCDNIHIDRRSKRISDADVPKPRKVAAKISAASLKDRATPEEFASAVAAANKQRTPEERRRADKKLQESIEDLKKIELVSHIKSIRDAAANHVISVREAKDKIKAYLETQEGWRSKDFEKGWAGTKTSAQTMYALGIYDIENMSLDDIVEMVSD